MGNKNSIHKKDISNIDVFSNIYVRIARLVAGGRKCGELCAARRQECGQFHKSPTSERYAVITVKANKFVRKGGDKTKKAYYFVLVRVLFVNISRLFSLLALTLFSFSLLRFL